MARARRRILSAAKLSNKKVFLFFFQYGAVEWSLEIILKVSVKVKMKKFFSIYYYYYVGALKIKFEMLR